MFLTKDSSSPYYQVVYFIDGKRTKKSTKKTTYEEAQKFLSQFHPEEETETKPINISLTRFQKEYVEYVTNSKSKHYLRSVNLSFSQLLSYSGDIFLQNLTTKILDKFIISTFARAPKAASLYYRTLKAAFTKAVVWEYLNENPLKKIKAPKVEKTFPVFIAITELNSILENTSEAYLKNIFIAGYYTGMRLGEILNMKWNWIDFQQNVIKVQCSESFTTKSKKERIIPISQTLRNVLLNQFPKVIDVDKNNYVFVRVPGIKFNENFISKQFKKSVRVACLDDKIHFHTLRHSFASMLVQRGVSLYVVKELLGHGDLSTTQIYSHLQNQNLMDAVNLL